MARLLSCWSGARLNVPQHFFQHRQPCQYLLPGHSASCSLCIIAGTAAATYFHSAHAEQLRPPMGRSGAAMLACRKWGSTADRLLLPEHPIRVLLRAANVLCCGASRVSLCANSLSSSAARGAARIRQPCALPSQNRNRSRSSDPANRQGCADQQPADRPSPISPSAISRIVRLCTLANLSSPARRRDRGAESLERVCDQALGLPAQPVDATQALNLSAGVSNCKVSRGRSLS